MPLQQLGPSIRRPVTERSSSVAQKKVNKQFLLNTVAGVKSHNRREEEEDCWRQHRLQEEQQQQQYRPRARPDGSTDLRTLINQKRRQENRKMENSVRPDNRMGSSGASSTNSAAGSSREFWAEAKLRAMTANGGSGSSGSSTAEVLPRTEQVERYIDSKKSERPLDCPVDGEKRAKKISKKRVRDQDVAGEVDDRCDHARKKVRDNSHKRDASTSTRKKKRKKSKKKKR